MASLGMLPRDRNDEADDLMTLWDIYELHDDDVLAVCERLIESRIVYFVR